MIAVPKCRNTGAQITENDRINPCLLTPRLAFDFLPHSLKMQTQKATCVTESKEHVDRMGEVLAE